MAAIQAPHQLQPSPRMQALRREQRKSNTLSLAPTGPSYGYSQLVGQRRNPSREPPPASARRLSYNSRSDAGSSDTENLPNVRNPSTTRSKVSLAQSEDATCPGDHLYEVAPGRKLAYCFYGSTASSARTVCLFNGAWQCRKAGLYYGSTPEKMNVRLLCVDRASVARSDKNPLTEGREGACAVKSFAKDVSKLIRLHLKLREYWFMSYSGGACFALETAQYLFDNFHDTPEQRRNFGLKGMSLIAGLPPAEMVRKTMPWLQRSGVYVLGNYPDLMVKLLVRDKKKAEKEGALPPAKISAHIEDDIIPTDSSSAPNASEIVSDSTRSAGPGRVTKNPKKKGVIGQVMKAFGGESQASQNFYNKQRNKVILRKVRKEVLPRKEGIIRDASNILSTWNRPPSQMTLGGRGFPVFLWYSTTDELIPLSVAREFAGSLRKARGCQTEYTTAGDSYGIFLQELPESDHFQIQRFIKRILTDLINC